MRYQLKKLDQDLFPRTIDIGGVPFYLQTHDENGGAAYTKRTNNGWWNTHHNHKLSHLQVTKKQEGLVYCINRYLTPNEWTALKQAIDDDQWDVNFCKVTYQYKDRTTTDWGEEVTPQFARIDIQLWVNVWITDEQLAALKEYKVRVKNEAKEAEERKQRRLERERRAQERRIAAQQRQAEIAAQIALEGKSQRKAMTLAAAIETLRSSGMEVTISGKTKI